MPARSLLSLFVGAAAPLLLMMAVAGCEAGPTYHQDIAPMVARSCMPCHASAEGHRPSLAGNGEAKEAAYRARHAVEEGRMPPGNLERGDACKSLTGPQPLSQEERALWARWIEAGLPEGEAEPEPEPARVRPLDAAGALTVGLPEPYLPAGSPSHPADDHRCFVAPLELPEGGEPVVTAFEVLPGVPELVHHVMLFALPTPGSETEARWRDELEPGPGWSCFGAPGIGGATLLGAWAPGYPVVRLPEGTGLLLVGGAVIVQVHYYLEAEPRADDTQVRLELSAEPLRPLAFVPFAATDLVLPPGLEAVSVGRRAPLPVPGPLEVFGVFPHMHLLGRALKLAASSPAGATCLAEAPRWSYAWQEIGFYDEPAVLPYDAELELTCTFSTLERQTTTVWGDSTEDEMCMVFLLAGRF